MGPKRTRIRYDLAVRIQTRENSLGSVSVLILLSFIVWEGEGLEEGGVNWRVPTGNARLYTEFQNRRKLYGVYLPAKESLVKRLGQASFRDLTHKNIKYYNINLSQVK